MDNPNLEKDKTTWLENLEAESWSAELIISGAAIYGSLQLPWLLNKLIHYSLLLLSDEMLDVMYMVYTYVNFTIAILIINFIVHFVLRSFWVGLVGLASVYPHGVNLESDSFSRNYLQKLKADFGDLRAYNVKIDQACSLIFAFSFAFSIIMLNFALLALVAVGLAFLIVRWNPEWNMTSVFFFMLFLIVLPSLITGFLNLKFMREKPWVQKIHYPFAVKVLGRFLNHIFYQPIFYINSTFITNVKKSQYTMSMYLYMILTIPAFGIIFSQSELIYTKKEFYFKHANREDRYYPRHYADQHPADQLVTTPQIQSEQIFGSGLRLFIPLPTREEVILYKKYGKYQEDAKLSEEENRVKERAWLKEKASQYFRIEVNGKKFAPLLRSYYHPNHTEFGFTTFIPASLFKEGENLIYIRSDYTYEGKKRESFIPFLYSSN